MEPLYWSPASPVFFMSEEEAKKLPQYVVWFGATMHCPKEAAGFIKPELRDRPCLIQSNFELTAELKAKLTAAVDYAQNGQMKDAWDARCMRKLLQLQDECLALFATAVAEARSRKKQA